MEKVWGIWYDISVGLDDRLIGIARYIDEGPSNLGSLKHPLNL